MLRAFVAVVACVALINAETPSIPPSSFGGTSFGAGVPQLIMQQEVMRRLADVFLGFSGATHFQMMAANEMQSWQSPDAEFVKYDFYNEGDNSEDYYYSSDDSEDSTTMTETSSSGTISIDTTDSSDSDAALLEVESKVEFFPYLGQQPQPTTTTTTSTEDLDFDDLQHRGALEKIHALKFLQMQIALAASDVDKAYWMNKLLATQLPPQLLTWKVYKNYLSTLALSFLIQLHDSFTQEAFHDEFNDHYGHIVLGSSFVTEAFAEHKTYSTWFYLSVLKFQLFYVNMYEHMTMGHAIPQQPPVAASASASASASFLETESIGGHPQALLQTYAYVSYFTYILKFYGVWLEMMLAQQGMMMGQLKMQAFMMHRDGTSDNDMDADTMIDHAKEIDSKHLPGMFGSWAMVNQWRFMFEFYLLFLDMQMPMMAAGHMAARAEDAMQNTNFVQTSEPVLNKQ